MPVGLALAGLTGLASSGEKDVSLVSGVPSPESAAPLEDCGEWLYLGLNEDIVEILKAVCRLNWSTSLHSRGKFEKKASK